MAIKAKALACAATPVLLFITVASGWMVNRHFETAWLGIRAVGVSRYGPQHKAVCDPAPQSIRHLLIVGSDGMRADTLENLQHPVIEELAGSGFYTRGYTQPSRTGAPIEQGTDENIPAIVSGKPLHDIYHKGTGLTAEGYDRPGGAIPDRIETLFEIAKRHGFHTGLVYSKAKAREIAAPEKRGVDYVRGNNRRNDNHVHRWAIDFVNRNAHQKWFLLLWFSEPDYVQVGTSPEYRNAVARNLDFLAAIVDRMKASGAYCSSIIALTADHGMSDGNGHHGRLYWNDPRVYEVPWLVAAPSLKLMRKGNGRHYNHELSATVSHLVWDRLPGNSDSIVRLEVKRRWDEQQRQTAEHQSLRMN